MQRRTRRRLQQQNNFPSVHVFECVSVREWENKYRTTLPKIQNILFRSLSSTVQHITHSTRSYIFRIFGVLCCRRTPLKKSHNKKTVFLFFLYVLLYTYVRVCIYIPFFRTYFLVGALNRCQTDRVSPRIKKPRTKNQEKYCFAKKNNKKY